MSSHSSDGSIERDLEEVERREQIAREASDAGTLDELWAEGMIVSTNNLLLSKERILKRIRDGSLAFSKIERSPSKIVSSGSSAVSSGSEVVVVEKGPERGKILHCTYFNCWARKDGKWHLLARQVCVTDREPLR